MQLNQLKPNTPRKNNKRVGRGGKRGTYSGKGSKGQKSRAGAGVKPGFRGGDNRLWQLFPKQRGASKKPGNSLPHFKHRFFRVKSVKPAIVNLNLFNTFNDGDTVNPKILLEKGLVDSIKNGVKVLGGEELKKKLEFGGFVFSASAKEKILKAGGKIES